jgi:hypothetical protein
MQNIDLRISQVIVNIMRLYSHFINYGQVDT